MFDVLIVGGGLSGTITAAVLARTGARVALVDRSGEFPASFRAEQLVGPQIAALGRLGVLQDIVAGVKPATHAVGARAGRIIGGIDEAHYGLRYHTIVSRTRAQLPSNVDFIIDRVVDVGTGPDRQSVALGSGRQLDARLVVIATGEGRALVQQIGIQRRIIREGHSLTLGFDIAPAASTKFRIPLLTSYPRNVRHRIDYLTVFPIDGTGRANLFTYGEPRDPWIRKFRDRPRNALLEAFPELERLLGPLIVLNPVQVRVNDLWVTTGGARDGVVLIGDAYQTSCPAPGTGVSRLLLDIERLCRDYVPRWLAAGSVTARTIATFYNDPIKHRFDQATTAVAEYQRSLATENGLRWRLRRRQLAFRQLVGGWRGGPLGLTGGFTFARLTRPHSGGPRPMAVRASPADESSHPECLPRVHSS